MVAKEENPSANPDGTDVAFCLKLPLFLYNVCANCEASGETERMRRLLWAFAVRLGYVISTPFSPWGDSNVLNLSTENHTIPLVKLSVIEV